MGIFKFKQFDVVQDRAAHKIGTDAVLLGAWTSPVIPPASILDIGTGTGVVALMLAQRYGHAQVDALEIEDLAFEQATVNFENSPYGDRLFCYHASFQEFYEEVDDQFDLMVSNPPYFDGNITHDSSIIDNRRQQARFDDALPFEQLIYGVYRLLKINGVFACIIPAGREDEFLKITKHFQLAVLRKTYVRGTNDSTIKRVLLEFCFRESEIHKDSLQNPEIGHLTIEHSRHVYTADYVALTQDFYLKM